MVYSKVLAFPDSNSQRMARMTACQSISQPDVIFVKRRLNKSSQRHLV